MTPRARALLTAVSAANLLQNLMFPVLAVRALGAGVDADALFMVFVLPGVITVLLSNSVLNWLTPRLVARPDDASRRVLCWSLLWVLLAGVGALCAVLWLGMHLFVETRETRDAYVLAGEVFGIGLLAVLTAVVAALAQSLFVAERDVLGGEWRTLLGSTLVLLLWWALAPDSLAWCAALFALRHVAIAALLLPRLGRVRAPDTRDGDLRGMLRESRLLLLAATYHKSEPFVDRMLLGSVSGGAVSAYHVAGQVLAVVTQLSQRVMIAPLIAPFAEAVQQADIPRMRRIFFGAVRRALLLGISVWVLLFFAGHALLRLLFLGAPLDDTQLALTAQVMVVLGGYMLAVLLGLVSAQVYYCTGQTRRVAVYSSAAYTVGLVLKVIGLWQFGFMGLVAAISLSWLLNVAWFWSVIPRIFREVEARGPQRA